MFGQTLALVSSVYHARAVSMTRHRSWHVFPSPPRPLSYYSNARNSALARPEHADLPPLFLLSPPYHSTSDWPTIPQVYLSGEFVGGCDILLAMHSSGELETLLVKEGVIPEHLEPESSEPKKD